MALRTSTCGHPQRTALSLDTSILQHVLCPKLLQLHRWGTAGMVGSGTRSSIVGATMVSEAADGSTVALKTRLQQKGVRKLRFQRVRGISSHIAAEARSTGCLCLDHLHQKPRCSLPTPASCAAVLATSGSLQPLHTHREERQTQ